MEEDKDSQGLDYHMYKELKELKPKAEDIAKKQNDDQSYLF
jgi:hypothetical protein